MLPANEPWRAIEFAYVFLMWAVMMVGMMAPSVAPMILMYARVGRQGRIAGKSLAATGWFAAGYFLAWIGFSLAATLVQWVLEREALLDPRMASASNTLGAIVLIAAGVYQWTPLKDSCLAQCQTPLGFLIRHGGFRGDVPGCLGLGLRHGAYCVGCCWVLMALLFVVGVMNVLWIALLALLVLLEKLTPWGRWLARAAGVGCVAAGVWMVSSAQAEEVGSLCEPIQLRRVTGFTNRCCAKSLPCTYVASATSEPWLRRRSRRQKQRGELELRTPWQPSILPTVQRQQLLAPRVVSDSRPLPRMTAHTKGIR
jgi:predicted metal-binding membrane protein